MDERRFWSRVGRLQIRHEMSTEARSAVGRATPRGCQQRDPHGALATPRLESGLCNRVGSAAIHKTWNAGARAGQQSRVKSEFAGCATNKHTQGPSPESLLSIQTCLVQLLSLPSSRVAKQINPSLHCSRSHVGVRCGRQGQPRQAEEWLCCRRTVPLALFGVRRRSECSCGRCCCSPQARRNSCEEGRGAACSRAA